MHALLRNRCSFGPFHIAHQHEYDEPVDLAGYDRAFELLEGGAASA